MYYNEQVTIKGKKHTHIRIPGGGGGRGEGRGKILDAFWCCFLVHTK